MDLMLLGRSGDARNPADELLVAGEDPITSSIWMPSSFPPPILVNTQNTMMSRVAKMQEAQKMVEMTKTVKVIFLVQ